MEKTIRWFATAFALAFGSTIGALSAAAPGDLIYEANGSDVQITAQQAAQAGSWAVSAGIWDGAAADMTRLCVYRAGSEFRAQAMGLKTSAPASIPLSDQGVRIVGRVE